MPKSPAESVPLLAMPPVKVATLSIKTPVRADVEIVPALLMPPRKVEPWMKIAVAVAVSSLVLSIRMPWFVAEILPLSTIEPVMVLATMLMAVAAAMVPALEILPVKVETPETAMPDKPAVIVPLLLMPPVKVETGSTSTPTLVDEIVPALLMPPRKVGPSILMAVPVAGATVLLASMLMPRVVAEIVPLSTMAPAMVLATMSIPTLPVMLPELEMLPVKVETLLTKMPMSVDPAVAMSPELEMPPSKLVTLVT